jgi:hypothetical protein
MKLKNMKELLFNRKINCLATCSVSKWCSNHKNRNHAIVTRFPLIGNKGNCLNFRDSKFS